MGSTTQGNERFPSWAGAADALLWKTHHHHLNPTPITWSLKGYWLETALNVPQCFQRSASPTGDEWVKPTTFRRLWLRGPYACSRGRFLVLDFCRMWTACGAEWIIRYGVEQHLEAKCATGDNYVVVAYAHCSWFTTSQKGRRCLFLKIQIYILYMGSQRKLNTFKSLPFKMKNKHLKMNC